MPELLQPLSPPLLPPLQAVVIDLDGTLVDTLGDFEAALAALLAELGRAPVGRDFIARTVGKGAEHLVARTLAEAGAPAELLAAACARYQQHYERINGRHARVYPGVVEGLQALRARGLRLACLTNKPGAHAQALLAALGLADAFEYCFGGDAFARKKPDPLPLVQTCQTLGTPPAATIMIGDSSNDATAARAAGCPVVLVSYGYNHGEPVHGVDCDAVIERIDALDALLG